MSLRDRMADSHRADVAEVQRHALGTRFRCRDNGKTYQLGAKHGPAHFWMLEESTPPTKGTVSAAVILKHFDVIDADTKEATHA